MAGPFVHGVLVTPEVAAVISPYLRPLLDGIRRDARVNGTTVPAEVTVTLETIATVARAVRAGDVPRDVPHGIPQMDLSETLETCTTTEAAKRLGVTERAVRARLQRGTLAGEQSDGRWIVYLSKEAA